MIETEQAPASGGVETRLCGVCLGRPLASGRPCICGGVGTEDAEMYGLRAECFRLDAELTALRARVEALTTPDSFWLYEDPEQHFNDAQDLCYDAIEVGEAERVLCGRTLPSRWAAHVRIPATETSDEDSEIQMFATEAEALAALTPSPTPARTEP